MSKGYRITIIITKEELKKLKSLGGMLRYVFSEDNYDVYDDRESRYRYKVEK